MHRSFSLVLLAIAGVLAAPLAYGYIGPGAGISVLGGIVSVVVGLFLAIGAILLWPIRRALKRRRARSAGGPGEDAASAGEGAADR